MATALIRLRQVGSEIDTVIQIYLQFNPALTDFRGIYLLEMEFCYSQYKE